jgi:hypothetical protein
MIIIIIIIIIIIVAARGAGPWLRPGVLVVCHRRKSCLLCRFLGGRLVERRLVGDIPSIRFARNNLDEQVRMVDGRLFAVEDIVPAELEYQL